MLFLTPTYRKPLLLAIAFHLLLLGLLLFQLRFHTDLPSMPSATEEIIQASLINEPAPTINKPIETQPSTPPPPPASAEEKSAPEPEIPEPTPVAQEKPKPVEKKAPAIEKIQKVEKKVDIKKEIEQQIAKEKPTPKIQNHVKQQKTIEQLLQQDLVKSASSSMKTKSTHSTACASSVDNKAIDHYKNLIITAIGNRWIMPEKLKKGLECHLTVRVAPGGTVTNVKLTRSSGQPALDHSAETAIYKASPLPVPKESKLFSEFREFNLVVRPEGITAE
jgi:colicin import membrane protein